MSSSKRVGVVLAGCGFLDGAAIQEACCTLLALDRAGASVVCMAPNVDQMHVVDHGAGAPSAGQTRNVLTESARIARGDIVDMSTVQGADLDALVFPGGFGAAKNLSSFAVEGADCSIHADVERLITEVYEAGKPTGFICIAPALAAKVLGSRGVTLTIGDDADTAAGLEALGAKHQVCGVEDIVVDAAHKIVSTPAYMVGPSIGPVSIGIEKLVNAVLEMA